MKTRYISILFIFFSAIFGFAQSVNLVGNIIIDNVDEPMDLSQVIIVNKQTEEVAKSDENGNFQIRVKLNDELIFRSGFTIPRSIRINEGIINKGFLNMHLDLEIVQLSEAIIDPLKPNLKDNISKEKPTKEKMYEIIGFDEEFKLDMIKYRLALKYLKKNNGDLRYENVLKLKDDFEEDARSYRPEIRKDKKGNIRMNEILEIKDFFTANYFEEILNIPTNKIIDFVSYCYDIHDFKTSLKQHNYDEMMFHFKEEASMFLKLINQKR